MRNSLIKRSITGVLAILTVLASYSCKNDSEENSDISNPAKSDSVKNETLSNSFSCIDIDIEIPADYIESVFAIKESSKILILGGNDDTSSLYLTDMDFSGINEIPLDFPKTENSQSYMRTTVASDGSIYVLFTLIDYGDFKLPDYDDPDFDYDAFDYETMNESANYSCTLYKLSSDGQIISENPVDFSKYNDDSDEGIYINDIVAGKDGKLIVTLSGEYETYIAMNENGEIYGKINSDEISWINNFTTDSEGNIVGQGYDTSGETIKYVDIDSKKFVDSEIKFDETSYITGINTGAGEYTLFVNTQTGLYGVKENNELSEIINWIDSDINVDSIQNVIGCDDGDFIVYIRDYNNNTSGFARLTKRNPEELANQTVITLAALSSDSELTAKVTEFNKSDSEYRIKIADYSKYNQWDSESGTMLNSAEKQLRMDILSGNQPDMIISYDYSIIASLASQGTYTDLYTFLESDDELSAEDIMPNLLKASEINDKLYSVSPNFQVQTFACKTKFFDEENWTVDDLINTLHDNPDMQLMPYSNSKEEIFSSLITVSINDCIDYEKQECHFDSEDFKKILEFCNEFPDENEEINWETATEDEMNDYWNEQETMCYDDKALISSLYFYNLTDYSTAKTATFGDDITLVGNPSSNGKGSLIYANNYMTIMESSDSKEGCWKFIKTFFDEDYQCNQYYSYSIPALISAFEKMEEDSMKKPYYIDDDGKKVEYENTYYINDREITIPPLTKKEKDFVSEYIKNTDTMYISINQDIYNIITEETTKYFKGEAELQQTIDKLQNRISILVSEQY